MSNIALVSFCENNIAIQLLSSHLKKNGYNTICFFSPRPLNSFNIKEFIKVVRDRNVAMVGMSVYTDRSHEAALLTKAIKESSGNISVIWGGQHAHVMPQECLRYADMVCMGEGEEALLELVKNIFSDEKPKTDIKNIWFKIGDSIIRNDLRELENDLDSYVYHDYDLQNQYLITRNKCRLYREKYISDHYSIVTSRGCPHSCSYCHNNYYRKQYHGKGKYLRFRTIDNIIVELVKAKSRYSNLKIIDFMDDLFVSRDISELKYFQKLYSCNIGLPFFALVDMRECNEEKIKILKDSGLIRLQIGMQSGCERFNREVYNRQLSNKHFFEMANTIARLGGITVVYDLIFNNPYETIDDIKETIRFLLELPQPFEINGHNLIFFPGTDITEKALRDGFIFQDPDTNIFSTITDESNSPLFADGDSVSSSRYFRINFNSNEKIYWNKIFVMFQLPHGHYRNILINFFLKSCTSRKKIIMNLFVVVMSRLRIISRLVSRFLKVAKYFAEVRLPFAYKQYVKVKEGTLAIFVKRD